MVRGVRGAGPPGVIMDMVCFCFLRPGPGTNPEPGPGPAPAVSPWPRSKIDRFGQAWGPKVAKLIETEAKQEFGQVRSSRFEEFWATCLFFLYSGQDRGNWVKVIEGLGQVWARFWTDMGQASGILRFGAGLGHVVGRFWTGLGGRGQV